MIVSPLALGIVFSNPLTAFFGGFSAEYDLLVFFSIGLFGGAHCIGMCGPLVTTYAERMDTDNRWEGAITLYEVRQHALFNIGRTVGYAFLGGLFGLLGALLYGTVSLAGIITPVQGTIGVFTGGAIVVMGVTRLAGYRQGSAEAVVAKTGIGSVFARSYTLISTRIDRWVNGVGIVGLGALHGLLPCMLLYPAFLYVFAQGSPLYGLFALAALGLGTIPHCLSLWDRHPIGERPTATNRSQRTRRAVRGARIRTARHGTHALWDPPPDGGYSVLPAARRTRRSHSLTTMTPHTHHQQ